MSWSRRKSKRQRHNPTFGRCCDCNVAIDHTWDDGFFTVDPGGGEYREDVYMCANCEWQYAERPNLGGAYDYEPDDSAYRQNRFF